MITTIEEFLNKNNTFSFPNVPTGSANSISEFFTNCVEKILSQNKETVIKWHRLLMRYADDKDSILLSRLYESRKVNDEWDTRRGMYTRMKDGFQYAFATNFFAILIYTMAYYDFVPSYEDFKQIFTNKKISLFSFIGTTSVENEYAAFRTHSYPPRFYTQNWYLAHTFAVNDDDYYGYSHLNIKNIFSPGTSADWKKNQSGVYERYIDESLTEDEKKVAKAHFLRFVDPLNYFLVPNTKHVSYKSIGEDKDLLNYMRRRAFDIYGDEYKTFLEKILVNPSLIPSANISSLGNIELPTVVYSDINLSEVTKVIKPTKKEKIQVTHEDSKIQIDSSNDEIFKILLPFTQEPFDKSFSETELDYENEYIQVRCFYHSNKWLGRPHDSEMDKIWSIIYVPKKSFEDLSHWKNLRKAMDISIDTIRKGKNTGCYGIRIKGMKQKPNSTVIRKLLDYIFEEE